MIDDRSEAAWFEQAACKGLDPELFFPGKGERPMVLAAKAVCAECPVISECLEMAIGSHYRHKDGIFGGLTGVERRRIHAARRAG